MLPIAAYYSRVRRFFGFGGGEGEVGGSWRVVRSGLVGWLVGGRVDVEVGFWQGFGSWGYPGCGGGVEKASETFRVNLHPTTKRETILANSTIMAATGSENSVRTEETQTVQKCKRCKENGSVVVVRHESLCRFVSSSVVGLYEPL